MANLALATGLTAAAAFASSPSPKLSNFIGLQHFQPCYFLNASLPVLLDGAAAASNVGTTAFKFLLSSSTPNQYPFNNGGDPWPSSFSTLVELASSSQVKRLLSNEVSTFNTFVAWAYRIGPGDDNYWCNGVTVSDLADETSQFADLTAYLLSTYEGTGLTFILEHWEGDWSARCGSYNASVPPTPAVALAMQQWLAARQAGVDAGRTRYCEGRWGVRGAVKCDSAKAVMLEAGVSVFHGAEVNLVVASIDSPFPNIIRSVIPFVRLDTVSYSSYDAQSGPVLGPALDFIALQHNRTAASPDRPIFITEFGVPEMQQPQAVVEETVRNVLALGRAKDIAHVFYWETFNNVLATGGNCVPGSPPVTDPTLQAGFWALLPNGTRSWVGQFLSDIIANRTPMPTPPPTLRKI